MCSLLHCSHGELGNADYRRYYLCFLPFVHVLLVLFQEMGVEAFEAECVAKAEARAAQALMPIIGLCLHSKVGVVDQFDEVIMPEVNISGGRAGSWCTFKERAEES